MKQYIVFRARHGQYIVRAETAVRAVQAVLWIADGFACDWVCHRLETYPKHLQDRLLRESTILEGAA